MRDPRQPLLCARLVVLLLTVPALGATAPQQPPGDRGSGEPSAERISEEIDVREAEVLLDLPPRMGRRFGLGADDFEVVIGGAHHRPVKLERLGRGEAHLALYFDATGPDPFPVHLAALTLAERADELTGMGPVEVVLADPEPRTLQPPTTDPYLVRQALAAVAGEMRKRPRPALTVHGGGDPGRWRRAAEWAAASPARGPRFLFLATQGFLPDPEELDALGDDRAVGPVALRDADAETGPLQPSPRVERVLRAARALAAAGWVVVPVHLSDEELERRRERPLEYRDWDDEPAYGINLVPLIRLLLRKIRGRSVTPPVEDEEEYRLHTTPDNAALVAVARETGGEILGYAAQLDRTLDDLKDRRRLWYAADELTAEPQELEVLHLGDGRRIRARRWVAARE